MSLEDEKYIPKYDRNFITKVGGRLQTLYEEYGGNYNFGVGTPFDGKTFESVYNKVKELVEPNNVDVVYWIEPKADFLASDLVYWHYLTKVEKMTIDKLQTTKLDRMLHSLWRPSTNSSKDKKKKVFKWALINGYCRRDCSCDYYENCRCGWFDKMADIFGLEDRSWVQKLPLSENLKKYNIRVEDLTSFRNLTHLYIQDFDRTTTVVDTRFISQLVNLKDLYLSFLVHRVDLSCLSNLTNLEQLDTSECPWRTRKLSVSTDLSPLAGLTNLQSLTLRYKSISDISPLAGLTKLRYLNIGFNRITDLSPLVGLTRLAKLDLQSNKVIDVSPLSRLTTLTLLVLYDNPIADMSPLVSLTRCRINRYGYGL